MKNKIIGTMLCVILVIASSIIGFNTGVYKQKKESIQSADKVKEYKKEAGKIAIVNMDEGVKYDTEIVNYGTTLLASVSKEHVVTGLEDARKGVLSGKYNFYIIIPTTFSENVESINNQPQQANIEYAISSVLESKERELAIYDVQDIYKTLNDNLTQIYMATILEEFHDTQDAAGTILENDINDTATLSDVSGYDLREYIKLPELKMVENTIKPLDLQTQYETSEGILEGIDTSYKTSLTENQSELDYMKSQNEIVMGKADEVKSTLQTAKEEVDQTTIITYDDTERAKAEDNLYQEKRTQIQQAEKEKKANNDTAIKGYNEKLDAFNQAAEDISLRYDFAENQLINSVATLDITLEEGKESLEVEAIYSPEDVSEVKKMQVNQNTYRYYSITDMTNIVKAANLAIQERSNIDLNDYYTSQETERATLVNIITAINDDLVLMGGASHLPMNIDSWEEIVNQLLPQPEYKEEIEYISIPDSKTMMIEIPKEDIVPPSGYIEEITGIQNSEMDIGNIDNMISTAQAGRDERNKELKEQTSAFESKSAAMKDKMIILDNSKIDADKEQIMLSDHLLEYDPLSYIKDNELREYRSSLNKNSREIESIIQEQNTGYEKYVNEISTAASENTTAQTEAIQKGQEASEEKLETGLASAKASRSKNNEVNSALLQDFTLKLPYTRIGQVENRTAYTVMSNPVIIQDKSTVLTNSEQINKEKEAMKERNLGQSMKTQEMTTAIVAIIAILLIFAAIMTGRRRKMVEEF